MRALVQRVKSASVTVDGATIATIGPGLVCLIGIGLGDTLEHDGEYIAKKILKARVFAGVDGGERPWDADVVSRGYEVLLVSQFTLYGSFKKNKPDWSKAMPPQQARSMYEAFKARMQQMYAADKVFDGRFGAMMDVQLVNDGPVTFMLEAPPRGGGGTQPPSAAAGAKAPRADAEASRDD